MAKHEDNAVLVLLVVVIGLLFLAIFWALLRITTVEGQLKHSTKENDKAAIALTDARRKLEEFMKTVPKPEKGDQ